MDPMSIIIFAPLLILLAVYLADRNGWHATMKRLTTIIRANIEAGKPVKQLERKADNHAKDKWTAEFEGKKIDSGPNHVIVKTWYGKINNEIRPFYQCKCGHKDWHINIDMAKLRSGEHVKGQNKAEELLKKNGGTHAW